MKFLHPYSKYGLALVMLEEGLNSIDKITHQMLKKHLIIGLNHYRIEPKSAFSPNLNNNGLLNYSYIGYKKIQQQKNLQSSGNPKKGVYLTPNFITTDMQAKNTWNSLIALIEKLSDGSKLSKSYKLTKSLVPVSNKFNAGKLSQAYPKSTLLEACLCAITTTTPYKPCLAFKTKEKGQNKYFPQAVIPDLSVSEMKNFIELFKTILQSRTKKLMKGSIRRDEDENVIYFRPRIHRGNFPFAPQSSSLASIGLLAAIGRWAEEAQYMVWAEGVLESLVDAPVYLITYKNSKTTTYNHYLVDLAKDNELDQVIHGLEQTKLYGEKKKDLLSPKYQQFAFFASRFLQLFNPPAFKDFLAFRAEYKPEILILLQIYFGDIMNISSDIIQSSMAFGLWLNRIAYFVAKNEVERSNNGNKTSSDNQKEKIRQLKAKTLVELESSALSAKTETALISQIVARAGRLSGSDVPAEAKLFMEATMGGQISIDDARNLLIAFSRVRSK
jgi:hypothetical protein